MAKKSTGFTLVEVLMAISIGAMLMMGASFFMYTVLNLWGNVKTSPRIEEHLSSLEKFFDNAVLDANHPIAKKEPKRAEKEDPKTKAQENSTFRWDAPEVLGQLDKMLAFDLSSPPLLFQWEEGPVPPLTCYIYFDKNKNLSLLWHKKGVKEGDKFTVRRTLLSPHIKELKYYYYDDLKKGFTKEDKPKNDDSGNPKIPDSLLFILENEMDEKEIVISLGQQKNKELLVY